MTELALEDQALARSRIYGLLARLLVRGVDRTSLAQLEQLGWAPASDDDDDDALLDRLAAEHHATFAMGVFPYAGVFLDRCASAGACADQVRDYYGRAGFTPVLDDLAADHLGVALAFLAFVTGAQADALADGHPSIAGALDPLLAEFLDACVLSYLPALVCSVEALPGRAAGDAPAAPPRSRWGPPISPLHASHAWGPESGFWGEIVRETLNVIAEHRSTLPGPITPIRLHELHEPHEGGDLLADPRTGLRQIAEHLLTPAASAVFSTRADIATWARQHQLPRGFGSRLLMLENLLRSAVEYGELASLLAALDDHLVQRDHALARLAAASALELAVAPWRAGLARTRALLNHLRHQSPPWTSKPSTTTPPAP